MARRILTAYERVAIWREAAEEEQPRLEDLISEVETGNGRWRYPYSYFSPNTFSGYGMHNWEVAPTNAPAVFDGESYGRKQRIYYDPARVTVENGEFRPQVNHPEGAVGRLEDDPDTDLLWRGMSSEEYEKAKELGYFETNGSYNLGPEQDGKTFFSTQRGSASTYANGFAPWQFVPTFDRPAHVVGIPNRPDVPRGPLGDDPKSHEVGISGRIPFSEVSDHWVGNAAALQPGEWTGTSDPYYRDMEPPRQSVSPRAELHWERDPEFAPRTASRTAMPAEDAYDGGRSGDFYRNLSPPGHRIAPKKTRWYHRSQHDLPEGADLVPHGEGGMTPEDVPDYLQDRRQWVWMDRNSPTDYSSTPDGFLYEVSPSEGPYPWNGEGVEGWVAPGARVVRKVNARRDRLPHIWRET